MPVGRGKGVNVGTATETDMAGPVQFVKSVRGVAGRFVKEHPKWSATAAVLTVGGAVAGIFGPPWGIAGGVLALLGFWAQRRAFK